MDFAGVNILHKNFKGYSLHKNICFFSFLKTRRHDDDDDDWDDDDDDKMMIQLNDNDDWDDDDGRYFFLHFNL